MHVSELGRPRAIPDYGDLFTIQEFEALVRGGSFTDFDGHGNWSDGKRVWSDAFNSKSFVYPSSFSVELAPKGATHVVWFNK